jgi:hypothetical protein
MRRRASYRTRGYNGYENITGWIIGIYQYTSDETRSVPCMIFEKDNGECAIIFDVNNVKFIDNVEGCDGK